MSGKDERPRTSCPYLDKIDKSKCVICNYTGNCSTYDNLMKIVGKAIYHCYIWELDDKCRE